MAHTEPLTASPEAPASGPAGVYNERLYLSLLTHINTTEQRIEALTRLALRHLAQAPDTWSAIRKAFVLAAAPQSLAELDGPRNRALWCLVDALLKHAPHVYSPLISPRLLEYVTQQTPLQLMSSAATAASTLMLFGGARGATQPAGYADAESEAQRAAAWRWWESLLLSWEAFLPADAFAGVRHYVTQRKSTAELDGALAHAAASAAERSRSNQQEATLADMQQLRDDFDALRYLCVNSGAAAMAGGSIGAVGAGGAYGGYSFEELLASFLAEAGGSDKDPTSATTDGSARPTTTTTTASSTNGVQEGAGRARAKRPRTDKVNSDRSSDNDNDDGESEGEEGEYVPEYIDGAKPRQLPDRGLPAQRRRREARRRQREDDY